MILGIDRRRIGLGAAGIACFINVYATQPMLAVLARDFHVPLPQTGQTVTATLLAVTLVAPFVGALSDALGRRRLMLVAASLLALPTLLAGLAPSYWMFLAARFAQGLCMPFIFAIAIAYATEEAPGPEAMRLTGFYQVMAIIGGFLSRFMYGGVTDLLGWRWAFAVGAVATGAAAALLSLLPPERNFVPVASLRASFANYWALLRDPRLLANFVMGFSVLFGVVATFTFVNVYLASPPFSLSPGALGAIFTVYLLASAATGIATRLTVSIGRRPTMTILVAVGLLGMGLTLAAHLPLIITGLALITCGIFPQQALSLNFVATRAARARSTALGIYTTSYYLGGALGGVLPGTIWHLAGWPGCIAMVACLQIFVLVVALRIWREEPVAV